MANPSPYQADFPALFLDWANGKIAEAQERINSGFLSDAETVKAEADISYLKGAIERIAGNNA